MASEEIRKIVMGLRPIDDDFMKVIFQNNNPLVEYILRIILNKNDLYVEKSETQYELEIFGSRKLFLDVFAKDSTGKCYDIEIQRADAGAVPRRARYHSAALDVDNVRHGTEFNQITDSYIIFITENDVMKGNLPKYIVERVVLETNELFRDGAHIIYVNGAYSDIETEIGRLIHDFVCKSAEDMLCQPLADITYKYKNTLEGVDYMCKAVEEYGLQQRNEGIQQGIQQGVQQGILETIKKLIKKGKLSYEEIAENLDMPVDEVRKVATQI